MPNKLLEVKNLVKIFHLGGRFFGSKLKAVNNVSFDIEAGKPEILTFAGETGSGKTTVARMILGLEEPTSGKVIYKGRDVTHIKKRQELMKHMKEVQPIFQNPFETFNPLKKVDSYLFEMTDNYHLAKTNEEKLKVIEEPLNSVGLTLKEIKGRYPNELSGGQLQRASVARALITRPSLLIADEPVSMVDASLRMSIVNLFAELKNKFNVSVLYITHDLATAYYISDRIAIMLRGDVVEFGDIEKVMLSPLHPYTKILIESVPQPDPEGTWKEDIKLSALEVKEFSRLGCKFYERCPFAMEVCKNIEPPNVFEDGREVKCHLYSKEIKNYKKVKKFVE
ncbi:peptide ABC transporter ATP-binding protein [Petrotoga sp. 9PW.55.5.1]|uniref:ABC transporter ATP-binding protein n=1 Tax=Petrotoga sp. 9PW.55.5.1 TaxID=1308979 RepID=UPI000DC2B0B3|nr:ABC transporter ATP-binding protein [Petrotoga sp. 9PW.55.5.1]RAO99406.1 peptide ABC transporter ATP-binding protein [Petrotoga sp. 9PW.55.5.1]